MTEKTPPSRPALRKSVDAGVHPALAGRPVTGSIGTDTARGTTAAATPATAPAGPRPGPPLRKTKRAPTSDAVRPSKKDPAVKITLELPKSLRKRLRRQAERQGISPALLAAQLLAEGLQED